MTASAFKCTSYVVAGARISFGIPQEAYEWVRDAAREQGLSASRVVDHIVSEAVSGYPGEGTLARLSLASSEYGLERRALLRVIVISAIDGKLAKGLARSHALPY